MISTVSGSFDFAVCKCANCSAQDDEFGGGYKVKAKDREPHPWTDAASVFSAGFIALPTRSGGYECVVRSGGGELRPMDRRD